MAEEIVEKNPFDGMTFGQATLKLKAQPELASKFDAMFKDEEEYDTLERARLHLVNSYYRGTTAGASWLRNASILADPETWKNAQKNEPTSPYSVLLDVTNPARWNRLLPTQKNISDQYAAVIEDLAKYERMKPADSWKDFAAAIGGGIAGSVPSLESLLRLPIPLIGQTPVARIAEGALQGGVMNVATDPLVQELNIGAGVQKDFDWYQTALAGPLGAVIGGGLVGAGQVLSKTLAKETWKGMALEDPQARTLDTEPSFAIKEAKDEKKVDIVEEQKIEAPKIVKEGEAGRKAGPEEEVALTRQSQLTGEMNRPDQGIPFDGEAHVIKSQQQLVQDLEKEFDVDIRQGRMTMKDALATYNNRTGVIHTKEYSDFEVATHETAHAIHKQMMKDGFDRFLRSHDTELGRLDYDQDPIFGQRYFEGFAEWVRYFVGNPARATRLAPGFTAEFLNFMEQKNPEYLKKLIDAAANYHEYLTASSLETLRATTKQTDKRGWYERTTDTLTEQGLPKTIGNYMARSYDGTFDKYSAIPRTMRQMAKDYMERNGKLAPAPRPSENPELLWRGLQRSGQTAQSILRDGVMPYGTFVHTGPSMRDVLLAAHRAHSDMQAWDQKLVDDFNVYLVGREALERWNQFERGDLNIAPHPMKAGDITQAIADMDDMYPQFFHAAQLFVDFHRSYIRDRMLPAGLKGITPQFVDKIEKQEFYAPFRRDVTDRPLAGEGDRDSGPIKSFKGSSRDVLAPLEQTQLFIERVERAIIENDTKKALVKYSQALGEAGGRYVEPIRATDVTKTVVNLEQLLDKELQARGVSEFDRTLLLSTITDLIGDDPLLGNIFQTVPTRPRGEPIVFYSEDGVLKAARMMSEKEDPQFGLYETLTAMPNYQRDAAIKVMNVASNVLTRSIVVEPSFAIVNFFRDQFVAGAFIPRYIPFVSAIKGAAAEYGQKESADLYRAAGGVLGHHQLTGDEEAARASLDKLSRQGYFVERATSLSGWGEMITSLEMATRLSAFEKARAEYRRQGLSDYDAIIQARHDATDLYDMGRYGSRLDVARAATPFLNPYFQGLDKLRRSAITPILRAAFQQNVLDTDSAEAKRAAVAFSKMAILGTGLGFGWAAMNWDSEVYRDADPDVKARYFLFPIGDRVVALPKPFELAIPFTLAEYAFAQMKADDPRAADQMAKSTFDVLQPPIPFFSNPLLRTPVETGLNARIFDWQDLYKTFFDEKKPIVPARMEGVRPEAQYLPKTSPLAKRIGEATGLSPIKIDYMIGGFFGNWGKNVADFSRGLAGDDETKNLEDSAVFKRWVKDPSLVSNAPEQFWNYMGKTAGKFSTAVTTYNKLGQRNDLGVAQQAFFDKLQPNEKAWVTLQRGANPDDPAKLAFKAEDRRIHPFARAKDAVTVLNTLKFQLEDGSLRQGETGEPIVLAPPVRKAAREAISKMALMEFRNALVMTKEPGYADRQLFDLSVPLEQLKVQAPELAKELITRYATKKIYRTTDVAASYDRLRDELLTNGSRADIGVITDFVKQGGYEFGGERVVVRQRRSIIPGSK